MTYSVDLPTPARAMAIGAHADDIEFGAGATLAKWAAHGCRILHVVCTDGSKGTWDVEQDIAELVVTRQHEQRAASHILGGDGEAVFLGYTDGELDSGLVARGRVAAIMRQFRPDIVLGHDPWKRYRLHPDHRHAGLLAVEGIVAARDHHFYPEQGLAPHRPSALLLFEADEADHVESVAGFEPAKVAALLAHRSQLRSTMHVDEASEATVDSFTRDILAELTAHGGLAGIASGEAFKAMTDL